MSNPNKVSSPQSPGRGEPEELRQPGNDRMEDSKKKVVNEEEQNRAVNTGDEDWKGNNAGKESLANANTVDNEKPDGGSEIERPHRIEGDDADGIERKIPNM